MRKLTTIIIFLVFVQGLYAQFSTAVELRYLDRINLSQDKMLHRQNWHNAELVCDSLILKPGNPLGARFFSALAKSYLTGKNYEMAVFTVIRQRCLYPSDSVNAVSEAVFRDAAVRLKFTEKEITEILVNTSGEFYLDHKNGLRKAVITTFNLKKNEFDNENMHLIMLMKSLYPEYNKDMVISEIAYMIKFNIPEKYRDNINREAESIEDWKKNLDKETGIKFLKMELRYYRKNRACRQAKEVKEELRGKS
jgi:hypothetical protein